MARTVWSSDIGRVCPRCGHPADRCACAAASQPAFDPSRPVLVRRETKGRKGKGVTIVENVPLQAADLKAFGKQLKARCGSGGTVKDGVIEIQGEHRAAIAAFLEQQGWPVRRG